EVSEILRALGPDADRTRAVFITVDPERDTPAVIKDYLSSFDPHLSGLTGDPAAIAAVAKAYRVYFKKVPLDESGYTMDHKAIVYLMDKAGRFVSPFNLKRTTDAAAADLRRYLGIITTLAGGRPRAGQTPRGCRRQRAAEWGRGGSPD